MIEIELSLKLSLGLLYLAVILGAFLINEHTFPITVSTPLSKSLSLFVSLFWPIQLLLLILGTFLVYLEDYDMRKALKAQEFNSETRS